LKQSAEEFTGQAIHDAIITVPAYFDDLQRTATLEAGRLAGLNILRLINEPTAAAMAYGLGQQREELVAVYDFGGGTFDFSILEVDNNTFEVLTSAGDTRLGGDDLDLLLMQHLQRRFEQQSGFELELDAMGSHRLMEAAEKAKCELSTLRQTQVSLPFISMRDGQPIHMDLVVSRREFETLIEDKVRQSLEICRQALKDIHKSVDDLQKVILVGGSTRIPLVQEMIEDFFQLPPYKGVNPDEIVALGAATQAGVLSGALEEVILLDVTPHSLGVEVKDGGTSIIIEKNATIPIKAAKTFTTTEDEQSFVNIHIVQGEHARASNNHSLGKFTLSNIPPAPKGEPRIRVTFFINSDGVVEIAATELISGVQQSLTITHSFLDASERERRKRDRRHRERRSSHAPDASMLQGIKLTAASPEEHVARNNANFDEVADSSSTNGQDAAATATLVRIGVGSGPTPSLPKPPVTASLTPQPESEQKTPAPAAEWPTELKAISEWLDNGDSTSELQEQLLQGIPMFEAYVAENSDDFAAQALLARLYLKASKPEPCRRALVSLNRSNAHMGLSYNIYCELTQRFPNYLQARRDKADLALQIGELADAIDDLELLQEQDAAGTTVVRKLAEAYRETLDGAPDSTAQFKLVKIYLRLQKFDQSIDLLRRMIKNPGYREKALRILGLCYWQKNMHEMAWQTLRALPLDDELKDILYRLASDMESLDELSSAADAFDFISSDGAPFRDAQTRARHIHGQLQQRQEEARRGSPEDSRLDLHDSRFSLIEEINRGSMGIVYKARDKILDEIVALKILSENLAADPASVERFKQEARAAKRLSHPNIVRIHDFFESGEKRLLSMEYIEGEDLKKLLLRQGCLAEAQLCDVLIEVLKALDYAHGLGIIHRDIKPANIMVTRQHQVKVTDFGIAKILSGNDLTSGDARIVGTPYYMSPEQIQGQSVDLRSDLYSLGATCYELLSGTPPFKDGNIDYHHIHSAAPDLPESIASPMRQFVARCLQKKPCDRFQSSNEALEFLRAMD